MKFLFQKDVGGRVEGERTINYKENKCKEYRVKYKTKKTYWIVKLLNICILQVCYLNAVLQRSTPTWTQGVSFVIKVKYVGPVRVNPRGVLKFNIWSVNYPDSFGSPQGKRHVIKVVLASIWNELCLHHIDWTQERRRGRFEWFQNPTSIFPCIIQRERTGLWDRVTGYTNPLHITPHTWACTCGSICYLRKWAFPIPGVLKYVSAWRRLNDSPIGKLVFRIMSN